MAGWVSLSCLRLRQQMGRESGPAWWVTTSTISTPDAPFNTTEEYEYTKKKKINWKTIIQTGKLHAWLQSSIVKKARGIYFCTPSIRLRPKWLTVETSRTYSKKSGRSNSGRSEIWTPNLLINIRTLTVEPLGLIHITKLAWTIYDICSDSKGLPLRYISGPPSCSLNTLNAHCDYFWNLNTT